MGGLVRENNTMHRAPEQAVGPVGEEVAYVEKDGGEGWCWLWGWGLVGCEELGVVAGGDDGDGGPVHLRRV